MVHIDDSGALGPNRTAGASRIIVAADKQARTKSYGEQKFPVLHTFCQFFTSTNLGNKIRWSYSRFAMGGAPTPPWLYEL